MRRLTILTLLAACGLSTLPAQAGADATISSGPIQARITANPWRIAFTDARGEPVLTELTGGSTGATGSIGFRLAGLWHHATQATQERRDGEGYRAVLLTDDPARRIAISIVPAGDGVIAVHAAPDGAPGAEAMGIGFRARAGERYLGFGERSNALDQRGNVVENFVADGPYQPIERPFIAGFVPIQGYSARDDATYFPIPWLLSTAGYGLLLDNDETSRFRLGTDDPNAWSAEVSAAQLDLRVFAGPTPRDALARFSEHVGRQPPPAAPFFFGPWFQASGSEQGVIDTLRRADAPASVGQTYTHYLPCGAQQGNTQGQRERTARFHAAGLAVTTYFNPMVCTDYDPVFGQARDAHVLTQDATGRPYTYRYTGSTVFVVGQFDFTAPGATAFYGRLLNEAVQDGYDGWMEDFGEYTPPDSVSADGTPGPAMHNRYPRLYHAAARAYTASIAKPIARFNRSGWTGAAKESQIVWGGDPTTGWGFDGLRSAVRQGLSIGTSGVSLWGSDIGGYFTLGSTQQLDAELLTRWLEVGALSGVMRTEASGFDLPAKSEPRAQVFDHDVLPRWRRWAKLRTQLYPYLAAAQRTYERTGLPIMRAFALDYPDDAQLNWRDDEYGFGPDLLAAPVLDPGVRERSLRLPPGEWIDVWRSARYVESDGSLELGEARLLAGDRDVHVPAPLDELPLFARAGTLLALLPADVDTLADYGPGGATVRLRDRRGSMTLLAWPRGRSRTRFGTAGDRLDSREGKRTWTLRIRGTRSRRYELQAALGSLRRPLRPCSLELDGKRRSRSTWRYDARARVLSASFRTKVGRLVARSC